jgi:hypothetical protein
VGAEEEGGDVLAAEAERLLERRPAGVVLERGVRAGGGERGREGGEPEPHREVERGVPTGHVAAVERRGDGEDARWVGERGQAGEDGGQAGGIPHRDTVMRGAVRVVGGTDRRRRGALGPRRGG